MVFAANDRLIVAREQNSSYTLELWDTTKATLMTARRAVPVSSLALLPDAGLLALGSHRGTVSLHDPSTLEFRRSLEDPAIKADSGPLIYDGDHAVAELVPIPGAVLALPGRSVPKPERAIKRLDLARGGGGPILHLRARANTMAVSPDRSLVAVAGRTGWVEVWFLDTR
jgi:WD40 repeat protein